MSKILSSLRMFFATVLLFAGLSGGAFANNLPGSAQATVPEATEIATDIIVRSIKADIRPSRAQIAGVRVSTRGGVPIDLSATTGGTLPLTFGLSYRDVATADMDGTLGTGSVILGNHMGNGMQVFGGLLAETGDLRTFADDGRVKHSGVGLAFGVDYQVSDTLYLTGILGLMALDYDVARSAGAITGSFGANRQFIDLSADYLTQGIGGDLRLGFGLLYVTQKNDGYTESGGEVVDPFEFNQLSANLDMRNSFGQAGSMRPYVEVSARSRLSGSDSGSVLADPGSLDSAARLAVGFERTTGASQLDLGLGANFDTDSFSGLDAKLTYSIRF